MSTASRESLQKQVEKMQEGVTTHLGKIKTITFDSTEYKPAEISASLQLVLDTMADSDAKKLAYHDAVSAEGKAVAAAQPAIAGLTGYAYLTFGSSHETLADFGLAPRKRRQPTVKTKASAQEQARATREAGGKKPTGKNAAPAAPPPATIPPVSEVTATPAATSTTAPAKASGTGS